MKLFVLVPFFGFSYINFDSFCNYCNSVASDFGSLFILTNKFKLFSIVNLKIRRWCSSCRISQRKVWMTLRENQLYSFYVQRVQAIYFTSFKLIIESA